MRITQECGYAIRMMVMIANLPEDEVIDAATISEKQNIPSRFTVKILRKLVLSELIRSRKGAGGGYSLNRPASEITMKDIVEVIDGQIAVMKCIGDESVCNYPDKTSCSVHHIMVEINEQIVDKLESITLEKLK
ncbi:MAG: Rrf2 family transcriptional regulator [Bacillota bacterium]|nr:Rrf2 family transcriptional regulator [Bacillota bacterium]